MSLFFNRHILSMFCGLNAINRLDVFQLVCVGPPSHQVGLTAPSLKPV